MTELACRSFLFPRQNGEKVADRPDEGPLSEPEEQTKSLSGSCRPSCTVSWTVQTPFQSCGKKAAVSGVDLDHLTALVHIGAASFEEVAELVARDVAFPLAGRADPEPAFRVAFWSLVDQLARVCGTSPRSWSGSRPNPRGRSARGILADRRGHSVFPFGRFLWDALWRLIHRASTENRFVVSEALTQTSM